MGRKTERVFTKVSNIKEYMEVLKSHGDKVLFVILLEISMNP